MEWQKDKPFTICVHSTQLFVLLYSFIFLLYLSIHQTFLASSLHWLVMVAGLNTLDVWTKLFQFNHFSNTEEWRVLNDWKSATLFSICREYLYFSYINNEILLTCLLFSKCYHHPVIFRNNYIKSHKTFLHFLETIATLNIIYCIHGWFQLQFFPNAGML